MGFTLLETPRLRMRRITEADLPTLWAIGSRVRDEPGYQVGDAAVIRQPDQLPEGGWPDGPVAVWDPLGGPVGVSIAESLAGAGRSVTLVTPDWVAGTQLSLTGDLAPANVRLQQAGVMLRKRSLLRRVDAAGIEVEDRFSGAIERIPVGWLVDAGHREAAERAEGETPDSLRAGDAVAPRTIYEAVLEGRRAAVLLATRYQ